MSELQKAKIILYKLLLYMNHKKMTINEINTCYELSRDKDIQNQLNKEGK